MGESTGEITFINSHDYTSDISGEEFVGCLAVLTTEDGKNVTLYSKSLRLQNTLEMAYATKCKVTVDYFDTITPVVERQRLSTMATRVESVRGVDGPFTLKAMWTRK